MARVESAREGARVFWFAWFMVSSVGMVLCNKYVSHQYKHADGLILWQNFATVVFQLVGTAMGTFAMRPWRREHFVKWTPYTILWVAMLLTSLRALPYIAVATTIVFRNVATCIVALGEYVFFKKRFSRQGKQALAVMVVGSLIYSNGDPNYNPVGYMWIGINTLLWANNTLFEKWATVNTDQTSVGVSCYRNLLTVPLLLAKLLVSGEAQSALRDFVQVETIVKFAVFITGVMGCSLSIVYIKLNKFASATSITVAANMNKLVSAMLGAYVFKSELEVTSFVGLLVCMSGAYMFSQAPKVLLESENENEKKNSSNNGSSSRNDITISATASTPMRKKNVSVERASAGTRRPTRRMKSPEWYVPGISATESEIRKPGGKQGALKPTPSASAKRAVSSARKASPKRRGETGDRIAKRRRSR